MNSKRKWVTSAGTSVIRLIAGRNNIFLVSNQKTNILVDTGPAFMGRSLLKKLSRLNIGSIDFLLLTHTHFDHAANTSLIKERYHSKVIVHESEAGFLNTGNSPIPAGTNAFTTWLVRNFRNAAEKTVLYSSCTADILVIDELDLSPFGINALIVHTPGHSVGSLSLIVDNEIALVGDTFIGTFPGHCFPPFADDVPALMNSWQLLLKTGCIIFHPSHGKVQTKQMLENCLKIKMLKLQ